MKSISKELDSFFFHVFTSELLGLIMPCAVDDHLIAHKATETQIYGVCRLCVPYYIIVLRNTIMLIMMTSSDGNIFRVTGPLFGEFTGHR